MDLGQSHNLNGEFLILIGVLFVDLGQSHNPEVAGSNPAPATMKTRLLTGFHCGMIGRFVYE